MKPAKRAVDGISLAIPVGECFGLLGVNGKLSMGELLATYTIVVVPYNSQ